MAVCLGVLIRLWLSAGPTPPPVPTSLSARAAVRPNLVAEPAPYWSDPSIDAAVLKNAFAPPPSDLPPEALPFDSNTVPPADYLKALEGSGDLAAY